MFIMIAWMAEMLFQCFLIQNSYYKYQKGKNYMLYKEFINVTFVYQLFKIGNMFLIIIRMRIPLEIVWYKVKRITEVAHLCWYQMPIWVRVVFCLVPSFTYQGFTKMLFSVRFKTLACLKLLRIFLMNITID